MKMQLTFEVTEEKLKECICAGWFSMYNEKLNTEAIRDFESSYSMPACDIERVLLGCSLAEVVADDENAELKRIK